MNLGIESETLEFKKTTGELDKAVDNIASMLNVVYENIDNVGKGEGISHISLQVMKLKETDHLQISDMIGFGN